MSAEVASECRLGESDQNMPRSPDDEEQQRDPKLEQKHLKVESKPPKQGEVDAKVDGLNKNTTSHKENDQSVASNNAETGKKKMTEAPPPKVNPWTKNNNNPPCPPNASNNNTQDTGMFFTLYNISLSTDVCHWLFIYTMSQLTRFSCLGNLLHKHTSTLAFMLLSLLLLAPVAWEVTQGGRVPNRCSLPSFAH